MVVGDGLADAVFQALSHEVRRGMLVRLADGDLSVGELAEPLAMTFAAASKHVQVLERAGLVHRSVVGRRHVLRIAAGPLDSASDWIRVFERHWIERLDAADNLVRTRSSIAGMPIRDATPDDAAACAAIYAPYVRATAVSFELEPPTTGEMAQRIAAAQRTHAWVVLEHDGPVVGYAYGSGFKSRPAYRWSCEVSVYLEPGRQRMGGGRALYEALLRRLAALGFRVAVAGMTLPNDASVALHAALGFEPVGTYRRIGWKNGSWHDVAFVQRHLTP